MIIEPDRSGKTISDVCIAFGVSRETWYKWKRRYDTSGLDGLKNQSRKPHNIKYVHDRDDRSTISQTNRVVIERHARSVTCNSLSMYNYFRSSLLRTCL